MKTRALLALATLALCLAAWSGPATADQTATATLTTNGSAVGLVQIEGAPQGAFTVMELVGSGYVQVGSGTVGASGIASTSAQILYSATPTFQVRLRPADGGDVILLAIPTEPDPHWWWD